MQLVPTVVLSSNLGEGPDRESSRQSVGLVEDGGDVGRRGEERQSVLGEGRRRPQLTAGGHGVTRPVAHAEQTCPVAVAATVVDHSDESVEVGAVDQFVEAIIGRRSLGVELVGHAQTSGQG